MRAGTLRHRSPVSIADCALLALILLSVPVQHAAAHSYEFGDIAVGHVWAPPTQASAADIYGPLLNSGEDEDRLVAAVTPMAERIQFRFGDEPAAREFIILPPGKPVSLAAWGYHLELLGLVRPLVDGDSFELTLTFERAGTRTVLVFVEQQAAH
jgi:hypothetical protein